MIENFGIGVDIVDIQKFEKITYLKKPSFYKKTFLPSEIEYCLKFKKPAEHFAGKFAIKESVKKSINEPLSFLEIETYHSKSKPMVRVNGCNDFSFHISLSHEENFAIAIAISEKIS